MTTFLRRFPFRDPEAGAGGDVTPEETAAGTVPLARLSEVIGQRNTLKAEAAAAKAEADAVRAEKAAWDTERAGWGAVKTELETKLAATARRFDLARVGVVDDDHAKALADAYTALPEQGRPASEADLWAAIRAGTAPPPRTLVGFLPAAATTTTAATTPAAGPTLPTNPTTPNPAAPGMTLAKVEELKAIWRRDMRSTAKREAVLAAQAQLNSLSKT